MQIPNPPETQQELLQRAQNIAGYTLSSLARRLEQALPHNPRSAKGWIGQLLEQALGATAGVKPEPDFTHLDIELKTIPVDEQGKASESTFVCVVDLRALHQEIWPTSAVRRKLAKVLWVPITMAGDTPLAERRIGMPLLWQPSEAEEAVLRQDWEELTETIVMGELAKISSRQGNYLQIRPKAANARSLQAAFNEAGEPALTLPRGFYLRAGFTTQLLQKYYAV